MIEQTPQNFLSFADKFKLGCLLTQQQNPFTIGLAELALSNLPAAIDKLKQMDINTIKILSSKIQELQLLAVAVNETLLAGGKIFICGCGATGRLSIVLETLWRQQNINTEWQDKVVAFMAGGDAALIKSIQDFQDHPEFAAQQLKQLGYTSDDLLISSTEGGETSWVIGAVWEATKFGPKKPFILYGNPDQILIANVERSKQFIFSPKIHKINCDVGYMALAGSTRMQSTTILMYAIGLTLFGCDKFRNKILTWKQYANQHVQTFLKEFQAKNLSILAKLIEHQSFLYSQNSWVSYETDPYFAVTVLTDTTQRSPTFSLPSFVSCYDQNPKQSWCNLYIQHKLQAKENPNCTAWNALLYRDIRGLNSEYWQKYNSKVSDKAIFGFSLNSLRYANVVRVQRPCHFTVNKNEKQQFEVDFGNAGMNCCLAEHILLKTILNTLSTLVMGRMKRYQSNIMTYVRPTNYKLIDRAARYVMMLRENTTYQQAVRGIYAIKKKIQVDQPIVLKVIEYLNLKI